MSISKTTWKDFIRQRIVSICLLLFIAGAWCCAEWKFALSDMASSLLIRFDEPPEYTRTPNSPKPGKKKSYAPRETLRGLHQAQRQAGVLLVRSDAADRRIPVNPESLESCRFIVDTCLRDWAVTVADPQDVIPVCADGICPDGWTAYRFTEIKGDINVRRACPGGVPAGKEIRLLTVLKAENAREHAKLLVKADGFVTVHLNGKTVLASGKKPFSFRSNYRAVTVPLQAGDNVLFIQMKAGGKVQKLQVRLTDHEDTPLNFRGDENSLWQPVAK